MLLGVVLFKEAAGRELAKRPITKTCCLPASAGTVEIKLRT